MRLPLAALLFVLVAAPASAGPMMYTINITGPVVVTCGGCHLGDEDPANDITILFNISLSASAPFFGNGQTQQFGIGSFTATADGPSGELVPFGTVSVPYTLEIFPFGDFSRHFVQDGLLFGSFSDQGIFCCTSGGFVQLSPAFFIQGWFPGPGATVPTGARGTITVFTPANEPQYVPVPEPASLLLLGSGLAAAGLRRWRRR